MYKMIIIPRTYDPFLEVPKIGFLSQVAAVSAKMIAAAKRTTMILYPITLLALGFNFEITIPESTTINATRLGFKISGKIEHQFKHWLA